MRTSVVATVAGILVLAAGGGYYGLEVYPQQQFRTGLDRTLATLPAGTTATYKDAHYSLLSRQAMVTGLSVHGVMQGASPQPFDVTIDSIETRNPSLEFGRAWANAVAHPAALTPDTALAVAESAVVKGVTVHSAMINITEETARVDRLRIYPWALLHDGMPSWSQVQASLTPQSQPPTLADMQPMLRFEAAVMLAFAFDAHESDAMHVAETLPGIDIAYEVRKMTMAGFDRGVTKDGVIEGITAHSDKFGTFAIDRAVMGATDLRAPMIRLVNGEALSPALLDGIGLGRIDYDGITIQPPDKQTLHVGRVSLGPVAFAKGMPVSGALGWQDISIPRSMVTNATARDVLDKLGLETMTTSFTVSYDWDVAGQRASLHDTALKVNELGTLTLAADLGSVVANADALTQARLVHARLRLDDASLVDRMLRAGAAMAGTDLTAYRQQVMDQLRQRGATMGGDSPLIAAAGQAVADFVASPHSLTIELSPPAPVPLFALKGAIAVPAELAAVLGLSVSANQP